MTKRARRRSAVPAVRGEGPVASRGAGYGDLVGGIAALLEDARRASARAVNALMSATYWEIGRRIVEYEQGGKERAKYGTRLIERLSVDLSARYGRGFSERNLEQMRLFYLSWPISQTLSAESEAIDRSRISQRKPQTAAAEIPETVSRKSGEAAVSRSLHDLAARFPLPWSAYVRLLSLKSIEARRFYEAEALRGGWSVRQLDRQIQSQFYERTALARDKAAMLAKGARVVAGDAVPVEEEVKDPYILEFLGLKDEYSESELEEALVRRLEAFLLELGGDFCFVGRQKRLRIGDEWFRVDLVFFHRRLRCLVLIDLKLGRFTHADAGQMHVYLNYAAEHWTRTDENPPVGLILCAQKNAALARYALDNLPNKVLAAEYRTALPDEELLAAEIADTRRRLEARAMRGGKR
ncbi:MAG: DUF1016 family protein [Planctomycetes bacterium]|nr:DUF1016 family protein [Planctomycetota bacterium]